MAGSERSQVLNELDIMVNDESKVVSYKWLSRAFSLSANEAKEVLSEFVDKNTGVKGKMEVVYFVSGWKKDGEEAHFSDETKRFSMQLVSKSRLDAAKQDLGVLESVHVYSVQANLPKDPAGLWTTDFVQSEKLFNEPRESNNCLRDNRFSAIACPLVQRNPCGRTQRVAFTPLPSKSASELNSLAAAKNVKAQPAATLKQADDNKGVPLKADKSIPVETEKAGNVPTSSTGGSASTKVDITATVGAAPEPTKTTAPREPAPATSKRKAQTGSGTGGSRSLASLWVRAASKPKSDPVAAAPPITRPAAVDILPRPLLAGGDAEAQLRTMEDEGASTDDEDEQMFRVMRGQPTAKGAMAASRRKRRMVADDDDEEEDAMEASVLSAIEKEEMGAQQVPAASRPEDMNANQAKIGESRNGQTKAPAEVQSKPGATTIAGASSPKRRPREESLATTPTASPPKKAAVGLAAVGDGVSLVSLEPPPAQTSAAPTGGKRKEMRTRVDERGRDQFYYVWVDENGREIPEHASDDLPRPAPQKESAKPTAIATTTKGTASKSNVATAEAKAPPPAKAAHATASANATKGAAANGGTGAGSAKGPAKAAEKKKGPQQGNLLSFFGKK